MHHGSLEGQKNARQTAVEQGEVDRLGRLIELDQASDAGARP